MDQTFAFDTRYDKNAVFVVCINLFKVEGMSAFPGTDKRGTEDLKAAVEVMEMLEERGLWSMYVNSWLYGPQQSLGLQAHCGLLASDWNLRAMAIQKNPAVFDITSDYGLAKSEEHLKTVLGNANIEQMAMYQPILMMLRYKSVKQC